MLMLETIEKCVLIKIIAHSKTNAVHSHVFPFLNGNGLWETVYKTASAVAMSMQK